MRKVVVLGCPGAGKSTFARRLRDASGIPLYYLDMLWHNPDRTTCSPERFDAELDKVLAKDCWIMDGNYQRTAERRLAACDTAFLLDFPLELCLAGAEARIGKKREDMPWVETVFDAEFRQWILDFPQTKLPEHYRLLERYREGREIVVFRSRMEMERYLNVLTG